MSVLETITMLRQDVLNLIGNTNYYSLHIYVSEHHRKNDSSKGVSILTIHLNLQKPVKGNSFLTITGESYSMDPSEAFEHFKTEFIRHNKLHHELVG